MEKAEQPLGESCLSMHNWMPGRFRVTPIAGSRGVLYMSTDLGVLYIAVHVWRYGLCMWHLAPWDCLGSPGSGSGLENSLGSLSSALPFALVLFMGLLYICAVFGHSTVITAV